MNDQQKIYVKTVYEPKYMREPDIHEYTSEEDAEAFIKGCLEWGIGVVSCKRVVKKNL